MVEVIMVVAVVLLAFGIWKKQGLRFYIIAALALALFILAGQFMGDVTSLGGLAAGGVYLAGLYIALFFFVRLGYVAKPLSPKEFYLNRRRARKCLN